MAADAITIMDPRLSKKYKTTISAISCEENLSRFFYLGRDSNRLDGLNPSLAIIDEAAAIPERNVIEVMVSGMGARLSPLLVYITTASFSRTTKYYEERTYAQQVLKGTVEDDSLFSLI